MSLLITTAATDQVDCGNASDINDVAEGTKIFWCYWPASLVLDGRFFEKGDFGVHGVSQFFTIDDARLMFEWSGTAYTVIRASFSAFPVYATGKWLYVALQWKNSGVDSDQKIFMGDLRTPIAEASSYTTQTVGSGHNSDAGVTLVLGNNVAHNRVLKARMAHYSFWNYRLSLGELKQQQFMPRVRAGCLDFKHLGFNGLGSQADYTGKGHAGTVTGCSVADHVPLPDPFGPHQHSFPSPYVPGGALGCYAGGSDLAVGLYL